MKNYKKDIEKIIDKLLEGSVDKEAAVTLACVAYDKEATKPDADIATRREEFRERMKPYMEIHSEDTLRQFFDYWTAFKGPKSKLMKFETTTSFSMGMRLATWVSNKAKFARQYSTAKVVERTKHAR